MITGRMNAFDIGMGGGEDAADLLEAVQGLEEEMALEKGELIRQLTSVLERQRRFRALRRDHDVRFRRK